MELFEPWPVGYKVNPRSPYGPRVHPITRKKGFHHGVDVAMPRGTRLIAPADGVVVHKGSGSSGGINVILRHEGTWHTVYYHLQKPCPYDIGAQVKAGDFLAYVGNTGASTGPHLHWELRHSRTWGDSTDPMPHVVGPYVETVPEPVAPEPIPEPVEPEPVKPLPAGVPVTQAEPVTPTPRPQPVVPKPRPKPVTYSPRPTCKPKPKWEFSAALLRGFERIRRQAK
jgi:murein DD-endopeptidase MepM/ murein hydrolase activator NlpD